MPKPVTVRRVSKGEWRAVRELRLEALRSDPLAFGSTLEREREFSEETWRERCHAGASAADAALFVAIGPTGQRTGTVGAVRDGESLLVVGMWVRREWRGQGIGTRLMETLLDWDRSLRFPHRLILDVYPDQAGAVSLYRKLGFEFTGHERPLGHHPPATARQMVLRGR